jgi:hypothetical protein
MQTKFNTPLIPVSWGELIDKVTILEIKASNISLPLALVNIQKELCYLNALLKENDGVLVLIDELKTSLWDVNLKLWKIEDDIRDKESKKEFDDEFIKLARAVYHLNDERAKLKKAINQLLLSELVEEKSYKKF